MLKTTEYAQAVLATFLRCHRLQPGSSRALTAEKYFLHGLYADQPFPAAVDLAIKQGRSILTLKK